ncbi:MAG: Nif11 family protein, partial [Synechococcus sp. MOX_bin32]|nr:Nif11 family protein [Synechococcus sp. MOX_bin32]
MAEQDLIRFLNKISQLQALAERVRNDSSSREQLAACADHNQVVQLARSWGFDIGRRWGERDHRPGGEANL